MKEIWKIIEATNNHYEVSNLGNIRKDGVLVPLKHEKTGYWKVQLVLGFGSVQVFVHRVVAYYFCENPNNKEQVNHIDGNKSNNCAENLEWCTCTENQLHRINILKKDCKGEHNPMYNVKNEQSPAFKGYIYQIDPETNTIVNKYAGSGDAIRKNPGFKYSGILKAVKKINKTYKGYIWTRDISGFKTR